MNAYLLVPVFYYSNQNDSTVVIEFFASLHYLQFAPRPGLYLGLKSRKLADDHHVTQNQMVSIAAAMFHMRFLEYLQGQGSCKGHYSN